MSSSLLLLLRATYLHVLDVYCTRRAAVFDASIAPAHKSDVLSFNLCVVYFLRVSVINLRPGMVRLWELRDHLQGSRVLQRLVQPGDVRQGQRDRRHLEIAHPPPVLRTLLLRAPGGQLQLQRGACRIVLYFLLSRITVLAPPHSCMPDRIDLCSARFLHVQHKWYESRA